MKTYKELVQDCLSTVVEIMPWDLATKLANDPKILIIDVREPYEFNVMHIATSINVPRGVLESACEWDYEETVPALVQAREIEVVVVCRSGHRSVLAALQMQLMGYKHVVSLKTGLRGWNDYEQPLENKNGNVTFEIADDYFTVKLRPEQKRQR
jgi:rhodanese-related sulfurtransferase